MKHDILEGFHEDLVNMAGVSALLAAALGVIEAEFSRISSRSTP